MLQRVLLVLSRLAHKNHVAPYRTDLDYVSCLWRMNHLSVSYIDAAVSYCCADITGLRITYLRPGYKIVSCICMYILS